MGLFQTNVDREKVFSEYENAEKLRYSKPTRRLIAKARLDEDSYNKLYLGVPEDNHATCNG